MCLNFAKSTIPRYQSLREDIGVANLQRPWNLQGLTYKDTKVHGWTLALQTYSVSQICKGYHTKIPKFNGGLWRYKLRVSLKSEKSTIQRYRHWRVDVGVKKIQCSEFCKVYQKRYNIQRWTLALQAYSVRDICLAYHTRIQKFNSGRWCSKLAVPVKILTVPVKMHTIPCKDTSIQLWTLALQTYRVHEIYKVYHTKIQKNPGWALAKLTVSLNLQNHSTIQRYKNSRGDVGVTNLQCAWNWQGLSYKDT